MKRLRILGIRGIPAAHGGFETFAERLALYLAERGWQTTVYCQEEGEGPMRESVWQGVQRVHVPVRQRGPLATVVFDWKATRHAAQSGELCLTLGYNTAIFCALLRNAGVPNLINMDGIEWKRAKWGAVAKLWFRLNERAGCWIGDHLIADHPVIASHLQQMADAAKVTMIPYGADRLLEPFDAGACALGLQPQRYLTLIARPEPENSVLEAVTGFSRRARGVELVVLGNFEPDHSYHCAVKAAASSEVRFVGAIYDKQVVQSLRAHSLAYVHGHSVGGTNPSLVEALGAGNAVLAHDNAFNRWVAGDAAEYFSDASSFATGLEQLLDDPARLAAMRHEAAERFDEHFTWPSVLGAYERLLEQWLPNVVAAVRRA